MVSQLVGRIHAALTSVYMQNRIENKSWINSSSMEVNINNNLKPSIKYGPLHSNEKYQLNFHTNTAGFKLHTNSNVQKTLLHKVKLILS